MQHFAKLSLKSVLLCVFSVFLIFNDGFSQVTIATQDFETSPATPTLSYTTSGTGGAIQTGITGTGDRPASANRFFDGSRGYGSANGDNTITFGPINASSFTNINFSFRLASYSLNTNGNGADGGDLVEVSISQDGTTYSRELSIAGNNNACWNFSATGAATAVYDGNNTATSVAAPSGGLITTGFGNPSVTALPPSSTLYIRIRFLNNSANELWLIDQVKLEGISAVNPTLTASPSSLLSFNYVEGSGPSNPISYNLTGGNLSPTSGDITVMTPTNFEVSTSATGTFTDNLLIPYTSGTLPSTPIFVRLKAGLVLGNYGGTGVNVMNTLGTLSANVNVRGAVSCGTATNISVIRASVPVPVVTPPPSFTAAGTVTAIFGTGKFYIQDATGGIAVFSSNIVSTNSIALGDQIRVTGTPVRFNGEAQINAITCFLKTGTGTVPAPIEFNPNTTSLNAFMCASEGSLVKIPSSNFTATGTFTTGSTGSGNNYSIVPCNAQDITEIRVDPNSGTLIGSTIPTVTQDIIGVLGRFVNTNTDKLQLFPRNLSDLSASATSCASPSTCGITTFTDSPTKLDVVNWNIEWLGHPSPSNGPSNKALQQTNAQTVINGIGADVYMLQEICQYNPANPNDNTTSFGKLIEGLNTTFGANTYSGECSAAVSSSVVDPNAQRVCIIYKNSVVTKVFSRPMFSNFTPATYPPTGMPSNFWASGRKPFMFMAKVNINAQTDTILFVGLHAKAGSALDDYARRQFDVKAMYDTLAQYSSRKTIILGDMNDDFDKSIASSGCTQRLSSYSPFLYANPNETLLNGTRPNADWSPISKVFSDVFCASTAGFPDYIDHQLVSNEMVGTSLGYRYEPASVASLRPTITDYATTTSDHYATIARYEYIAPPVITSIVPTGNWSSPSTWSCNCVPTSADNVVIETGHIVTVDAASQAKSLNLKGTLNYISAFTLSLGM
jgi:hypothetical protein